MTEYRILQSTNISTLESMVNTSIKQGWVPTGGVVIDSTNGTRYSQFYQAIVKIS